MALFTVSTTTDLTTKGRRISSVHCFSTAGGVVKLNDGVGGTTLYTFNLAATTDKTNIFPMPALPRTVNGVQVAISGTDATCTIDIL